MHFRNLVTSLYLLLSIFVPALGLTKPEEVIGDVTYSLTSATNPSIILVSKYPELTVDTLDPAQPWDATNVGPDDGRRWNLYDRLKSLHSVESNGFLYYDNTTVSGSMKTDGQLSYIEISHIYLLPDLESEGIKIGIVDQKNEHKSWVNEDGKPDNENAAVWLITETAGVPDELDASDTLSPTAPESSSSTTTTATVTATAIVTVTATA